METVVEKFLRYVKIDTQSKEASKSFPSTEKQKNLGRLLADELAEMGAMKVYFDEEYGYVYGEIPGNLQEESKTLGFLAHMDTSPDASGKNVNPRIISNYAGQEILLGKYQGNEVNLSPVKFPELNNYVGQDLIVTDGTTLLGADDKAGIAEIMAAAEMLLSNSDIKHGKIALAFTPDEEIGAGVDHFDLKRFGADFAYTVDGGGIGELEYENFNAASAKINVHGVSVHPGDAKDKMKNASNIAIKFHNSLPQSERPEKTEGYQGFFHLTDMKGQVEKASLEYIVRDHDRKLFEEKKNMLRKISRELNEEYGEGTIELEIKDSYYNMKEKIDPDNYFLIENARVAMKEKGVEPKLIPIRGGTDGARLSFMGLPCPNLCTGGHNYHGRYEYVCIDSMKKIVEVLVALSGKPLL